MRPKACVLSGGDRAWNLSGCVAIEGGESRIALFEIKFPQLRFQPRTAVKASVEVNKYTTILRLNGRA